MKKSFDHAFDHLKSEFDHELLSKVLLLMKVSNTEELQPLLVLILINICLKIRAESIEYFCSYFYCDNFENVNFYVGYSVSYRMIVCPFS